jgi:hypothetical protein
MIYTSLRTLSAFVLALVASLGLIIGVEILSNVVHPFPSDFKGTQEEICIHVEKYPNWILAGVVVAWGFTAAAGTWISQRIGNVYSSTALGILLIAGVALNISMLPYPIWFKVISVIAIPVAAVYGARLALQRQTPSSSVQQV